MVAPPPSRAIETIQTYLSALVGFRTPALKMPALLHSSSMAGLTLNARSDHSANPERNGTQVSTGTSGNIYTTNALAQDMFQDKFMTIARGGSSGEKIMRGFLIGVAIGLIIACFVCCWYPCCRPDGQRRRRRGPRRPPVSETPEEEEVNRIGPPAEPATTTNALNDTPYIPAPPYTDVPNPPTPNTTPPNATAQNTAAPTTSTVPTTTPPNAVSPA